MWTCKLRLGCCLWLCVGEWCFALWVGGVHIGESWRLDERMMSERESSGTGGDRTVSEGGDHTVTPQPLLPLCSPFSPLSLLSTADSCGHSSSVDLLCLTSSIGCYKWFRTAIYCEGTILSSPPLLSSVASPILSLSLSPFSRSPSCLIPTTRRSREHPLHLVWLPPLHPVGLCPRPRPMVVVLRWR